IASEKRHAHIEIIAPHRILHKIRTAFNAIERSVRETALLACNIVSDPSCEAVCSGKRLSRMCIQHRCPERAAVIQAIHTNELMINARLSEHLSVRERVFLECGTALNMTDSILQSLFILKS